MNVLQRAVWNGQPYRLEDLYILTRNAHNAVCELWTHWAGWELRLMIDGDTIQTQVCRAEKDVRDTSAEWRARLTAKGWTITPYEPLSGSSEQPGGPSQSC